MSRRKHKNVTAREPRDTDIDQASDQSFPASDPPPWTLGSEAPTVAPPSPIPTLPPSVLTTLPGIGPELGQGANIVSSDGPTALAPRDVPAPVASPARRGLDTATLARLQGGYFAVTGVWPLLHMRSFRYVTGGKKRSERWLVKTVGVLVASIGAALLASTANGKRPDRAMRLLATTSALGLLAIDVWYVAKRRISPIYLADAAAEAALALAWSTARGPQGQEEGRGQTLRNGGSEPIPTW